MFITGTIVSPIEDRTQTSRYTLAVQSIDSKTVQDTKLLVYEPFPSICSTGQVISFESVLREPENFISTTGRVVEYKTYLQQRGIQAITFASDTVCKNEEGEKEIIIFAQLRSYIVGLIHKVLPEPESSLLAGLLLGVRSAIPAEIIEMFRITGLIHIIVLSGYNVTIVAEAIRRVSTLYARRFSITISILAVILFVLLAGADIVAMRAGAMAIIALLARAYNRERDGLRALAVVACLLVFINPESLYSTSFHLSFLATTGILLFSPLFDAHLLSCQQCLPIAKYTFHHHRNTTIPHPIPRIQHRCCITDRFCCQYARAPTHSFRHGSRSYCHIDRHAFNYCSNTLYADSIYSIAYHYWHRIVRLSCAICRTCITSNSSSDGVLYLCSYLTAVYPIPKAPRTYSAKAATRLPTYSQLIAPTYASTYFILSAGT